ncbi:MAG: UDP-N-acetylmuramoyl-L-alanine--D-glutamate ligase [Chloroflexi bacterium]|nr:UDP-N-acetylmuramoyl-L-alanine--D-glutamate ligase [Chloroflexota bacterium]MCL5075651.1 UDP-N-acetylmuramoyl-L-alanine--D-glutamate ligase [Chloroflexota bacterium]
MRVTDFNGKRITLIGLGRRTHVSLAKFLIQRGAIVTISDLKEKGQLKDEIAMLEELPVKLSLGGHREEDVLAADLIFVTPGAPRTLPCLAVARARGIPISSEIELFFELCPAPIIGITGSSGKTTTTALVGEILKTEGKTTFVGGNIGKPLIEMASQIDQQAYVVLELSSFQLEAMTVSPHVATILNITPNHLDRHPSMEDYIAAKKNIINFQKGDDKAILNLDDPVTSDLVPECKGEVWLFSRRYGVDYGAVLNGNRIIVRDDAQEETVCHKGEIRLLGEHNVENVLAAVAIGWAAGASVENIRKAVTSFNGVEHRLELVWEIDGVQYYNDSIATAPERTIAALHAFNQPIILIGGGRGKHLPLDDLAHLIVKKVKALVLLGELASDLATAVSRAANNNSFCIRICTSLREAVETAKALAEPGDIVLLSPAGTSYDMFRDFEERGHRFKEIVNALAFEKSKVV